MSKAQEVKFNFRKDSETGIKRDSVILNLLMLDMDDVVSIVNSGDAKQHEQLLDAINAVIVSHARSIVDETIGVNQDSFPHDHITWEHIANLPKAQRTGGGISKEVWESFQADYIDCMVAATGKTLEAVTNAAKLLATKFNAVKTNKPIINFLLGQLDIYTSNSQNAEEYLPCIEFLTNKAEVLLAADENALLANL